MAKKTTQMDMFESALTDIRQLREEIAQLRGALNQFLAEEDDDEAIRRSVDEEAASITREDEGKETEIRT